MKRILLLCLICVANPLNAANIFYEAVDLTDTTPGEDLWKYNYTVSNHSFDMDFGFSVFFNPSNYVFLEDPAPFVNSAWDILILQPDTLLPGDGVYDALALVNNPSLLDTFSLSFVWLGTGTPGSQSFELYDNAYNVTEAGITRSNSTNVPEPTTIFLLGSGVLALFRSNNKFKLKWV